MRGLVEAFDEHRGDGLIRGEDSEGFYFHCVNIADGSRTIAVGERVSAQRSVGHLGRDEATEIVPDVELD
jgi:cold shock CspA family protein